jgi:hypothetical protein
VVRGGEENAKYLIVPTTCPYLNLLLGILRA